MRRFRLPMFAVTVALLALIVLLATLQYRWLGRISDAERQVMRSALNTHATGFERDFDGEITRAYLLFQIDPEAAGTLAERVSMRYDRWQTTARYPRLLKDVYVLSPAGSTELTRFNPNTQGLEPVAWPDELAAIRVQITSPLDVLASSDDRFVVRAMPPPIWDSIPALLIPTPTIFFNQDPSGGHVRMASGLTFTILQLDRDYI